MLLTVQAYQTYICSVLQFVAQLEDLPHDFPAHECKAVRALFPGPAARITPPVLKDSKYWGFPSALTEMDASADAAKASVYRWENHAHGV